MKLLRMIVVLLNIVLIVSSGAAFASPNSLDGDTACMNNENVLLQGVHSSGVQGTGLYAQTSTLEHTLPEGLFISHTRGIAYNPNTDTYWQIGGGFTPSDICEQKPDGTVITESKVPVDGRAIVYRPEDGNIYIRSYSGGLYRLNLPFDGSVTPVHGDIFHKEQSGIAFANGGNIFEVYNGVVYEYDFNTGSLLRSFNLNPAYPSGNSYPYNCQIASDGTYLFFLSSPDDVYRYDINGSFYCTHELNHPTFDDFNAPFSLSYTNNRIYVLDDYEDLIYGYRFPPAIIHSPQAATNDSTPLLNATYFRTASLAWYTLDGNNGTNQTNTDHLNFTLPQLADGPHTVIVYAKDSEGNINEATQDFLVDTIAPEIAFDPVPSPANASVLINGTFVEEGAGIASVVVNGVSVAVNEEENSYSATNLPLVDGENLITVLAMDKAGNIGTNTTLIVLDTILPTATISAPVNNTCVRGAVDLIGNATDEANFNNYSVEWSDAAGVNWTEIYNSTTATEGTLAVWNTTALADGEYTIRLTVTDKAFNTNTSTVDIKVDNEPPIAAITEPVEGAYVCGNIGINGSADDENIRNYTVEWLNSTTNSTIFVSSAGLSGELAEWDTGALADGEYTVLLTVTDIEDNISTAAVNVTIDNTLPLLNITEPGRDRTWFIDNIVTGMVSDANLESAILLVKNETGAVVSRYELDTQPDNSFRERVEYYPEQLNTLELIAYDTAGNNNISSKTLYVENSTMQEAVPSVNASETVAIDAINETGTSIEFVPDVNATDVTFTVTAITNKTAMENLNTSSSAFGEIAVGKMVEIKAAGGLDGSNESQVRYVHISLFYSKDDLDLDGDGEIGPGDIDESSLAIYWYNETNGNWTKLSKGSPDWVLDAGRSPITGDELGSVWVKVKHLSSYSLAGSLVPEVSPEPVPTESENRGGHGFGQAVIIRTEVPGLTDQGTGTAEEKVSEQEINPEEQEIPASEILGEEAPEKETEEIPAEEESESSPGLGSILAAAGLTLSAFYMRRQIL